MIKYLGLILLFVSFSVFGQKCKVYGISDSPQKLFCVFDNGPTVHLTCAKGKYLLNDKIVETAFHAEVEEGSNPLIFKLANSTLTVVKEKLDYFGEFDEKGDHFEGRCH